RDGGRAEPRPVHQRAPAAAGDRRDGGQATAERGRAAHADPHGRPAAPGGAAIGADWFRPRAMRELEVRIAELAKRYVDRMADFGGECDFADQVAVHYP